MFYFKNSNSGNKWFYDSKLHLYTNKHWINILKTQQNSDDFEKDRKSSRYQSIVRLREGWLLPAGFGVKCENVSELLWKVPKKGHFKTKNLKKGSTLSFLLSLFRHLRKKSKILVQTACGDHIVFKFKLPINYA